MAKNDTKTTDNPKLKQKELSNGQISLYLDYYLGYTNVANQSTGEVTVKINRKKEFLSLYLIEKPRTPIERQTNKETEELAKKIRFEREQELKENRLGYRLKSKGINFLDYYQSYLDNYTKKDDRQVKRSLVQFKLYLEEEYPLQKDFLKPNQIDKEMVRGFVEYLQSKFKGEGAHTVYQRFKKVIKSAVNDDVLLKNPCEGVLCIIDDQQLKKDVLSMSEVAKLIDTTYEGQNFEIRRAFIFCLYTGIRFCDIIELKFKNVDYSNRLLSFNQSKTKGHSRTSGVVIPLNDSLLSLIGRHPANQDEAIFKLPSHTMCLKALRRWTKRAGINKHITWHCARHRESFNYVYSSILQSCICRQVTI